MEDRVEKPTFLLGNPLVHFVEPRVTEIPGSFRRHSSGVSGLRAPGSALRAHPRIEGAETGQSVRKSGGLQAHCPNLAWGCRFRVRNSRGTFGSFPFHSFQSSVFLKKRPTIRGKQIRFLRKERWLKRMDKESTPRDMGCGTRECPKQVRPKMGCSQNWLRVKTNGIPFWLVGEFTTHFGTHFSGWIESDVHWGCDLTHGQLGHDVGDNLFHDGNCWQLDGINQAVIPRVFTAIPPLRGQQRGIKTQSFPWGVPRIFRFFFGRFLWMLSHSDGSVRRIWTFGIRPIHTWRYSDMEMSKPHGPHGDHNRGHGIKKKKDKTGQGVPCGRGGHGKPRCLADKDTSGGVRVGHMFRSTEYDMYETDSERILGLPRAWSVQEDRFVILEGMPCLLEGSSICKTIPYAYTNSCP